MIAYCAAVMRMGGAEDDMVVAPHLSPMHFQMMRAGARGAPAARDQFGMPIMQSLKRCACIWPMWLRPSPSYCSLPIIWRHFCSSDWLSCLDWVFCAAWAGAASA